LKSLQEQLTSLASNKRLAYIGIVLVIVTGYGYLLLTSFPSSEESICVFKRVTTVPCPGCGMGRSTWSLLRGEIADSLFYHPLGIVFNVFMLVAMIWALHDLIKNKDHLIKTLKRPWPGYSLILLIIVILVVWIRNIYLHM